MLFKLSNLNSNLALTLGYLYQALNNSAQSGVSLSTPFQLSEEKQNKNNLCKFLPVTDVSLPDFF